MIYLQQLKDNLLARFQSELTPDKTHLFLVNGELSATSSDINYIARFLFIDCRSNDPFNILTYIRYWFKQSGRPVPDLNWDAEVIDAETYDLTIDIGLMDKLIATGEGDYHLCPPKVWSDTLDNWVEKSVADSVAP